MTFSLDLARFAEKAGDKADLVIRKVGLELLSSVVLKSPVKSGRFRGNWQLGISSPDLDTSNAPDKTGAGAINRGAAELLSYQVGPTLYITNALPYANRLEDGYSKQAPVGMVKITVVEFQGIVKKAAK